MPFVTFDTERYAGKLAVAIVPVMLLASMVAPTVSDVKNLYMFI